jgi:dodecin
VGTTHPDEAALRLVGRRSGTSQAASRYRRAITIRHSPSSPSWLSHRRLHLRRRDVSRNWPGDPKMKNHVYKILEIVGSSQTGIEDAINTAIELASKTVRNMDWFEVIDTRGHIKDGKIAHYQVTLKIGFTLETQ